MLLGGVLRQCHGATTKSINGCCDTAGPRKAACSRRRLESAACFIWLEVRLNVVQEFVTRNNKQSAVAATCCCPRWSRGSVRGVPPATTAEGRPAADILHTARSGSDMRHRAKRADAEAEAEAADARNTPSRTLFPCHNARRAAERSCLVYCNHNAFSNWFALCSMSPVPSRIGG